jgi:hypothetical protein
MNIYTRQDPTVKAVWGPHRSAPSRRVRLHMLLGAPERLNPGDPTDRPIE